MKKELLISRIQTPDGTILTSKHRHDYVTHVDKNGLTYILDGGRDYQRVAHHPDAPHKDASIYTDTPFEELRKVFGRGGYGKDGDQEFTWKPLCEMSDEWLKNAIVYNYDKGLGIFCLFNSYYMQELIYRRDNDIVIEDENNT